MSEKTSKTAIDFIELEHLESNQKQIAEVIGIEAYRRLCSVFGGEKLYITRPDLLINRRKSEIIRKHSAGPDHMYWRGIFGISAREYDKIMMGLK